MGLAFTFGLATLIRGGLLTVFGYNPRTVHTDFFAGNIEVLGVTAPAIRVAGFTFAVVTTGLFLAFLFYTRTGLAIRATAQSKENAGLMGIDVKRISSLVYAIYAGLTATVGVRCSRRMPILRRSPAWLPRRGPTSSRSAATTSCWSTS